MMRYCIIGYPISHSLSPVIYNAAFPAMGLDAVFEAWETPPDGLPDVIGKLRAPGIGGMMVTVPHKQSIMPLLDALDRGASAIGAVNCIVKQDGSLTGYNTDVYGFSRSLREAGFDAAGRAVLVLGAGGAAHAVGYGLAEAGAASITFANRTRGRAEETARHLGAALAGATFAVAEASGSELARACAAADLVVNCTSVGMRHGEAEGLSPLAAPNLRPGLWVYDTVYTPAETPLLRDARAAGARTVEGLEMLIYQAVRAVELWTGREPPVDVMRAAASEALGRRG